jgi:hypothetical protein
LGEFGTTFTNLQLQNLYYMGIVQLKSSGVNSEDPVAAISKGNFSSIEDTGERTGENADTLGFRVVEKPLAGDVATLPCGAPFFVFE